MIIWNKLMQIEDIVNGLCESDEDEEEYEKAPPKVAKNVGWSSSAKQTRSGVSDVSYMSLWSTFF